MHRIRCGTEFVLGKCLTLGWKQQDNDTIEHDSRDTNFTMFFKKAAAQIAINLC